MTNCNTNVDKKPHSHSYIYNSLRKGIVALAIPLAACGVHSDDDTAHLNTKAVSSHAPNTLATQGDSTPAQTTQAPGRRQTKAVVSAGSGNHALTSYEVRRLYGPGVFRQDALANTIVGINGRREQIVSNRFRATINGHLSTARLYWQPGRGYSAGNGGNIRLRLMPDDGSGAHRPNMSAPPLATAYFTPGSAAYRGNPIFNDAYFSSQQPLVAGRIYHLVLDNIHPAPHQNYISSNNTITHSGNGRPSRWVSPTDWATLLGTRNAWSGGGFSWNDMTQSPAGGNYYVPILQLTTRNGQKQGSSAMESGAVDPQRIFTATASHPVRERFRPYSTKRVSGLSFATAASVGGSLRWRIVQGNRELASGRISSGANYYGLQLKSARVGKVYWYDASFGAITLQAGQTYDVEFLPEGRSQWKFADFRNGSHHGFSSSVAFTESNAQHRVNGNWINAYHFNHYSNGGTDSNWPVVLHLD